MINSQKRNGKFIVEHEDKHFELRPLVVRYSNHRVHFKRAYAVSQIDCKILANFVGFSPSMSDINPCRKTTHKFEGDFIDKNLIFFVFEK